MATPTTGFMESDLPMPVGSVSLAEELDLPGAEADDQAEQEKKDEKKVRLLFKRIMAAKKQKKKWEDNYEIDRCHDYVRGFQRASNDEKDAQGEKKYQINKILAALKARIPALFYYFPYARVRPTYGRDKAVGSQVDQRCELLQDTLNTIIRQPKTRFKPETLMAVKEAHWSFGVIEVGYDAEWGENPFQQKPILVENDDVKKELEDIGDIPEEDSVDEALAKLTEVPHSETFYLKHIPARQFYVASNDRSQTETQDWLGYWEWMYVEDVKKFYENTDDLKASAKMYIEGGSDQDLTPLGQDDDSKDVPPDMVRVWKIWDQREKKRYVIAEGHERILKQTNYYYLPISALRFEVMPGEWYPIPPIYNQLTEQDEFNDSREWLRIVRKGTRPRYTYDKSAFSSDELEKLEDDEFFTMIAVENGQQDPIRPVVMPMVSDAVLRTLALSDSGFAEQAASSPVDRLTRGAGGKPTATEVDAMGQKGEVRDSYEQQEVANWLAAICSSLIKCSLEKMTLPQWVMMNTDPTSPSHSMEAGLIAQTFGQYVQLLRTHNAAYGHPAPGFPPVDGTPEAAQMAAFSQGAGMPPTDPSAGLVPGIGGQPPPPPTPPEAAPLDLGAPTAGQPVSESGTPLGQPVGPQMPTGIPGMMAQKFQQVSPEELEAADDGMQWDVTVDVESLSPVSEETYANRLLQTLNMLSNPGVGMLLAMSPPLMKKVMSLMGVRNSADQNNIFMAIQQKVMMEQQMAMAGGPAPKGIAPSAGGPPSQGGKEQPSRPGGPGKAGGSPAGAPPQ